MASAELRRRLIVTADDFGGSASINGAVLRAHQQGILTCASLMVNGQAFDHAVEIAKANPRLGVGLHLTLCCGRSTLGPEQIPDLINEDRTLPHSAVAAGFAYFFSRGLRPQLETEIEAQFDKFEKTGLRMDHVNGHLHFHLHPVVLPIVIQQAKKRDVKGIRLTYPVEVEWKLGTGRWLYRTSHWRIFRTLSNQARVKLRKESMRHTDQVFGLLEDSRVTKDLVRRLLQRLPAGESELYSHPSLDEFEHEYEALVSPATKKELAEQGIELIRYQDL